jgi:hypothetical protein
MVAICGKKLEREMVQREHTTILAQLSIDIDLFFATGR